MPHFRLLLLLVCAHATVTAADTWPGFRGAGDSHTAAKNLPWSWELRGRTPGNWNIRLPGYGQSSPVVWHDRVFVTAVSGEEKEHLHVLAVSLVNGEILWQRDFQGTQKVKDSDTVSRGAPTPVVDADKLYAVFESGDVLALTHDGSLAWLRSFVKDYGEIKGPHGYGSSPVLVNDVCILQVAHSGPSYILALDKATGLERWRTAHPSQTGWSTPAVYARDGRSHVIVSTSGSVRALDAATGREDWNFSDLQGNSTASPTITGKFVVIGASTETRGAARRESPPAAGHESPDIVNSASVVGSAVLQIGSLEDSQQPRLAWQSPKISAGYASPVVLDGLAYFVNKVGVVQCVDLETGKVHWQHRLPGEVWASPVVNNGHITFFCKHGPVITLKGGPEVVEVAESQVSTTDVVYGVAVADGAWIVRTGRGLARISGPPGGNASALPTSGE
jgi:outer membrane protein assembly factor BamB